MRYLALDIGARRTGVASGDDIVGLVQPLTVIEARRGAALLAALDPIVRDQAPDAIVVGLPLNMDDSEGPAARVMREFGRVIEDRFGLRVHLHDERLSSAAADDRMARTGRSHREKRALRDALAAATILEGFLREARRRGAGGCGGRRSIAAGEDPAARGGDGAGGTGDSGADHASDQSKGEPA